MSGGNPVRPLTWELSRADANSIMDDIDLLGNDASLASKRLWGCMNTLFGIYEIRK